MLPESPPIAALAIYGNIGSATTFVYFLKTTRERHGNAGIYKVFRAYSNDSLREVRVI
jgi:hypothetical protein